MYEDRCHCGGPSMTLDQFTSHEWSFALRNYCVACASVRCDAYPGDCMAAKPWQDWWERPITATEPDMTVVDAALLDELVRTMDEPDVAPTLSLLAKAQRRYREGNE